MRTPDPLSASFTALACVLLAGPAAAQTKRIPARQLPRVMQEQLLRGTVVKIVPSGTDTVAPQSPMLTLTQGELLAARTGEHSRFVRVRRNRIPAWEGQTQPDSVFAIPFVYTGLGPAGTVTPAYRPVYISQGTMRYSPARDAFVGAFLMGLEDASDPGAERDLSRAIAVTFGGDPDSIAPPTLQFTRTGAAFERVLVVARTARDSVGIRIRPSFDRRGARIWLAVQPALTFEQPPSSLQGFGIESATLVVGIRGATLDDSIAVTVSANLGTLSTNRIWIGKSGGATVQLRSKGLGAATVRAVAPRLQLAEATIAYRWPIAFALAVLLGAVVGAAIAELRSRRRSPMTRRMIGATLGALVLTAAYVGLGLNLLTQEVDVPLADELAVFAFAALGALGGARLLTGAASRTARPRIEPPQAAATIN